MACTKVLFIRYFITICLDPKRRLFLYETILDCQRCRGLHFTPDQSWYHSLVPEIYEQIT